MVRCRVCGNEAPPEIIWENLGICSIGCWEIHRWGHRILCEDGSDESEYNDYEYNE